MKSRKVILVFLVLLLMLSGCGTIKRLTTFEPIEKLPTWKVNMKVPLAKGSLNVGERVEEFLQVEESDELFKLELITNQDGIFTYKGQLEFEQVGLGEDGLPLEIADLDFPGFEWGGQEKGVDGGGAISITGVIPEMNWGIVDPNSGTVNDIVITDGEGNPDPQTFSYTDQNPVYIPFEYEKITFTDSVVNEMVFKLRTDEPLDELIFTLYEGDPEGDLEVDYWPVTQVRWANIADLASEAGIALNADGSALESFFEIESEFLLSGKSLTASTLFYGVEVTAYTTAFTVYVDVIASNQMEVGEVIGGNLEQFGMRVQDLAINMDPFTPFKDLPIREIVFESGIVRINETKIHARMNDEGAGFLFNFSLDIAGSDLVVEEDEQGKYIDFAGKSLTPDFAIGASITPDISVYDVWDEDQGIIVPYEYALGFEISNLKISAVTVPADGLAKFVEDPNPDTPEWDMVFAPEDSERYHLDFPEGFNIGLSEFYLDLEFLNNTDFKGTLGLALNSYANEDDIDYLDQAILTMNIEKRDDVNTPSSFVLSEQPGYNEFLKKFVDILNSKPNYVSLAPTGSFVVDSDITVTTQDSFGPGNVSIELPLALKLFAGGMIAEDFMVDHIDLEQELKDNVELLAEFVNEANLYIDYENNCSIGFGAKITFTAGDYEPHVVDFVLEPAYDGVVNSNTITVSFNKNLASILAHPEGFEYSIDLILPNTSGKDHIMSLKPEDYINLTIYADGIVDVHVPEGL